MKEFVLARILPALIQIGVSAVYMTLRMKTATPEMAKWVRDPANKYIITVWHGNLFCLAKHMIDLPNVRLLVSPSKHGDILAGLADRIGYSVIRASSQRKTLSSGRAILKALSEGNSIGIVADGSRGPRCRVQPGVVRLAEVTGTPIVTVSVNMRNKRELNSWDRFAIPMPFSRCTVDLSDPIHVQRGSDQESLERHAERLESLLNHGPEQTP